jgi:hypothetical protein
MLVLTTAKMHLNEIRNSICSSNRRDGDLGNDGMREGRATSAG